MQHHQPAQTAGNCEEAAEDAQRNACKPRASLVQAGRLKQAWIEPETAYAVFLAARSMQNSSLCLTKDAVVSPAVYPILKPGTSAAAFHCTRQGQAKAQNFHGEVGGQIPGRPKRQPVTATRTSFCEQLGRAISRE